MSRPVLRSALLLFAVTLAPLSAAAQQPAASSPAPVDECEVIARVNGEVVLACEVLWQVNLILEDKRAQIPPGKEEEIRQTLMRQHLMGMLDMKMLYGDFRRKAPQADLAAIHANLDKMFDEQEMPDLMKRVGADSPEELGARLVELGTSLQERREDFYQRMIARSWVNESVSVDREVTHDQMLAYYLENAADFEFPTQARWEELMVRFDRFDSKADAYRALATLGNEAYAAVTVQADRSQPAFAEIAPQKSHGFTAAAGGRHDWTTQGALTAERVDEAIFALPVGEMSPILESRLGFHIVRVLERKQAGRTPFTEVQQEITEKVRGKRYGDAIGGKLDELRRAARIWTKYTGDVDAEEYANARAPKGTQRR